MLRRRPSSVVNFAVLGGILAFLFWQFHAPSLLFLNTTTAGGDTGSQVALPLFMKQHLLPHLRLTGWDPGWYDGFPAFTFYFPLPSFLVVVVNLFVTYNIAFKIVTALGSFLLPVAAWAFGRLWGLRDPYPACLAVATLPYLFDRTFTIYGGNIASTLAGEYAFSLGLALGLLFLGLLARGLRTGRGGVSTAVVLGLAILCHLLTTFFVLVAAVVLVLMQVSLRRPGPTWRTLRWSVPVGLFGGLLAALWWVPFALREAYTTDMGWQKLTDYLHILFPSADTWVAVMAGAGVVLTLVGLALDKRNPRHDVGVFLTVMALLSAGAVRWAPQGKIWNARFLPFWVFCLYLLAGVAVAEGGVLFFRLVERSRRPRLAGPVVPVAAFVAAFVFVGGPLGALSAFGRDIGWSNLGNEIGDSPADASFVQYWIRWNYTGYQQKASYPEYSSLISTMARLGRQYGCGRAMWEYESEQNRFGTPEALMLLPYWTHDCIDSMEGLLFESSSTTPYHFLNQSELSVAPSDAMLGLRYSGLNVPLGIEHLQMLGVKYYMAFSPQIEAEAASNPNLRLVASSGPWPDQYTIGGTTTTKEITWDIYEVLGSSQVAPLKYQPVVVTGKISSATQWLGLSESWYLDPARWPVVLAESGPSSWARVPKADAAHPPAVPLPPVRASHVVTRTDSISFDVSRTGVPVVVRTSYFPNWKATGATGPYRVTPNLMVVVPTSRHVLLHYGYTGVDYLGYALTALGLVGLVGLARRRPWPPDAVASYPGSGSGTEPVGTEGSGALDGQAGGHPRPDEPGTDPARPLAEPVGSEGQVLEPVGPEASDPSPGD